MANYAIGDLQGCYEPLQRLLDHINFNEQQDRLWFVGDLVNRGPDSLAVLRFIKELPLKPRISLGNHDLHLLSQLFRFEKTQRSIQKNLTRVGTSDTLDQVLKAPDAEELGHWLRQQCILYHDTELNVVLCHAGIPPIWDLNTAKAHAAELEHLLAGDHYQDFLTHLYGNDPNYWSEELSGIARLRSITNYFTRMRVCDARGHLNLEYTGALDNTPADFFPWFSTPGRVFIQEDIVFGHWAALKGIQTLPTIYPLDTGCVWGGPLTALRLEDKKRFHVSGLK